MFYIASLSFIVVPLTGHCFVDFCFFGDISVFVVLKIMSNNSEHFASLSGQNYI